MRGHLFTYGLIITFFGCVISPFLLTGGVPIFVIGAIIVFNSDKSLKTKIIATILTVFAYMLIMVLCFAFNNWRYRDSNIPNSFLIPENFEGEFRIVFGEKCGILPRLENNRRLIEIPSNGILILRTESNCFENDRYDEFYFVDKKGNRSETNLEKEIDPKVRQIDVLNSGKSVSHEILTNSPIMYRNFYLYKFGKVINADSSTPKFDSLTIRSVHDCRGK